MSEQADTPEDSFDDELGRAADEALGDEEGLASAYKSLPSVTPTFDLRYVTSDGQDPKNTRRSPLESDQGPGPGTSPSVSRKLPAKASDMLAWAKENGWLIDLDDLEQRLRLTQEIEPGSTNKVSVTLLRFREFRLHSCHS